MNNRGMQVVAQLDRMEENQAKAAGTTATQAAAEAVV